MASEKKQKLRLAGNKLMERGEIIKIMDQGQLVECKVISCLIEDGDSCIASLEILTGDRKGERIQTKLRPMSEEEATDQPK